MQKMRILKDFNSVNNYMISNKTKDMKIIYKMNSDIKNFAIFSALIHSILSVEIPANFCENNYFDSIYWTGFSYKLIRNLNNTSYQEWTALYDKNTESFSKIQYELIRK